MWVCGWFGGFTAPRRAATIYTRGEFGVWWERPRASVLFSLLFIPLFYIRMVWSGGVRELWRARGKKGCQFLVWSMRERRRGKEKISIIDGV